MQVLHTTAHEAFTIPIYNVFTIPIYTVSTIPTYTLFYVHSYVLLSCSATAADRCPKRHQRLARRIKRAGAAGRSLITDASTRKAPQICGALSDAEEYRAGGFPFVDGLEGIFEIQAYTKAMVERVIQQDSPEIEVERFGFVPRKADTQSPPNHLA